MFRPGTLHIPRPDARLTFALALALSLAAAGCASTGAIPQPFPRPGANVNGMAPTAPAAAGPVANTVADAYAIAGTALGLRGTPYRNGGSDPSGFDCSGFVWYVYAQYGIHVPRTVGEQFRDGHEVSPSAVEPGDLLFFSTQAPGATHVAMAIGGDEFVHAPSSRGEVRVERLSAPYWASRFVGARRVR